MRLIYKQFSVFAGFAVILAILVINMVVTRRQIFIQDSNQGWVDHTQQVLLELNTVESLLADAETGQRGYLYTEQPKYLEPYTASVAQIEPHIDKLAVLTADNPQQQARITVLRRLTKQKLAELAKTIALMQAGQKDQARTLVLSDLGELTMKNIRDLSEDMRKEEHGLQVVRLQTVQKSAYLLIRTLYVATSLAVIGLGLLAFYIVREMDQREKHASDIREREEWFRVTLSSIGDAVIATDQHGVVTFMNHIAEQLTGVDLKAAKGQPLQSVFPIFNEYTRHPVENPVAKVLELGRIMGLANHTVLQRLADGKFIPIEDSAAPIYDDKHVLRGVVMVFRDVSAEKQSQEVMQKAEKLAAAGRLAATVAHEVNNPLEAVCNLIYIIKGSEGLSEEIQSYLKLAEHELDRVAHITKQTLGFYRDSSVTATVDVREVVESVKRLYENKIRIKNITLDLDIAACPPVEGLQGELKQLVSNLISNAVDAVSHGGKISISVWPAAYPQGRGIEIKVSDSGPGISEEHSARIFEPFFTTKKDVGTGLGLWISKQIAERHGGMIEVRNGSNGDLNGAVFTVFLLGTAPRLRSVTETA